MCNIAGYVGTKPAAPILIEMMRKQEGLMPEFILVLRLFMKGKSIVKR